MNFLSSNILSKQVSYIFSQHSFDLFISSSLVSHRVTVLASCTSSKLWSFFKNANQKVSLPYWTPYSCIRVKLNSFSNTLSNKKLWGLAYSYFPAFPVTQHYTPLIPSAGNLTLQITFWFSEGISLSEKAFPLKLLCPVNLYSSFKP